MEALVVTIAVLILGCLIAALLGFIGMAIAAYWSSK